MICSGGHKEALCTIIKPDSPKYKKYYNFQKKNALLLFIVVVLLLLEVAAA